MNESSLWNTIQRGMLGKWIATRLETSTGNGVPDVTYTVEGKHGFLELKYIPKWPVRDTTLVKLPLRPEQKLWLGTRGKLADNCWVLVRIEDDFILLDWVSAIDACNGFTKQRYKLCYNWHKKIDYERLKEILEWNHG